MFFCGDGNRSCADTPQVTTRWQTAHVQTDETGRVKAKPQLRLCGDPGEAEVKRHIEQALVAHPRVTFVIRLNSGAFEGQYTRKDGKTTRRYHEFCRVMSVFATQFLAKHTSDYSELASAKLRAPDLIGMTRRTVEVGRLGWVPGRLFAFEVKKRGKKATLGQAAFIDLVRANGGIAAVVYSAQQAIDLLEAA